MRLLFVNYLHPDSGLVGAVRMQRFAEELARRGHQVVLLCSCPNGQPDTPASFAGRIQRQDWSMPLVLALHDDTAAAHAAAREPIAIVRKARTAARLLLREGRFWRWQRTAATFRRHIQDLFTPELAYATFGDLDSLAVARDYARQAAIPWVMDIKDPASIFIPGKLAPWLMRRYRGAVAVTMNSEYQRSHNGSWVDDRSVVIYSGVEPPPDGPASFEPTHVALVGSLYDDEAATHLLRGFDDWRRQSQPMARLYYFGTDAARLAGLAERMGLTQGLVIESQIPRAALLARCRQMAALLYVTHPEGAFNHKLLELAALGRPLIVSGASNPETERLCQRFDIPLTAVASEFAVSQSLAAAAVTPTRSMQSMCERTAWSSVAGQLEQVLAAALAKAQPTLNAVDETVDPARRCLRIAVATGGRFHVLDLARELETLGHEVRFYSYVSRRRAVRFGLPARCHVALLPVLAPFVLLAQLCARSRFSAWSEDLLHRAMDRLVALRLRPCDVFIGMSGMYVRAPQLARRKFGAKIVIERGSVHIGMQKQILDDVKALNPAASSVLTANLARELSNYAMADCIVVPSLHAEQSFLQRGFVPKRLFRNPYGVDLTMFKPSEATPRDPKLLLFVGGWSYQKGVDRLGAIMPTLAREGYRLCHVGGRGDAPVPNAPWFSAIGTVDQTALVHWYRQAGSLLLLSRQEGLSLVQVQALACGCPVIGTPMTGAADLQRLLQNEWLVQVVDPEDTDAVLAAVRGRRERASADEVTLAALRQRLSWCNYGRRHALMLEQLVARTV